jgi:hypothetical protein
MIRGGGIYGYCSANNQLIISQLGELAEHSLIHIPHTFTTSLYLQNPTSLITPFNQAG